MARLSMSPTTRNSRWLHRPKRRRKPQQRPQARKEAAKLRSARPPPLSSMRPRTTTTTMQQDPSPGMPMQASLLPTALSRLPAKCSSPSWSTRAHRYNTKSRNRWHRRRRKRKHRLRRTKRLRPRRRRAVMTMRRRARRMTWIQRAATATTMARRRLKQQRTQTSSTPT